MGVIGTELWSCGDFILNQYASTKSGIQDKFYYYSEDKLNDMYIGHVGGDMVNNTVLACENSQIRVLNEAEVLYSHPLDAPATCLFDGLETA